jgi:hypothetical protein
MASDLLERMRRNPAGAIFVMLKLFALNTACCSARAELAWSCEASQRAGNIDHSSASSVKPGPHSQACALY